MGGNIQGTEARDLFQPVPGFQGKADTARVCGNRSRSGGRPDRCVPVFRVKAGRMLRAALQDGAARRGRQLFRGRSSAWPIPRPLNSSSTSMWTIALRRFSWSSQRTQDRAANRPSWRTKNSWILRYSLSRQNCSRASGGVARPRLPQICRGRASHNSPASRKLPASGESRASGSTRRSMRYGAVVTGAA